METPATTTPDQYLVRTDLPVEQLQPDPDNANVMSEREFNLLCDNIQQVGITDPILVRPVWADGVAMPGKYIIVGGHHRAEAAKVLGYEKVPVTIITDPNFDEDRANFQMMRHNLIKGKLDTQKFVKLYEKHAAKYSKEQLVELFGFEEEAALNKLIKQTEKGLPKELKKKFKEASAEIKTINDLSKVLNSLFAKYGDTLKFGFMYIDFGGKDSVWLRLHPSDRKNFDAVAQKCMTAGKSVDGAMRVILQLIADGQCAQFEAALPLLPTVQIKAGQLPLEENEPPVEE